MIKILVDNNIDIDEFIKSICFVSSSIIAVEREDNQIKIVLNDDGDCEKIKKDLIQAMKKYKIINSEQDSYFKNDILRSEYYKLEQSNQVFFFGMGQIGFGEKGKFLLEYFDAMFAKIAEQLGAIEKMYPALLPIRGYSKTGYLKKTPQYAMFCSGISDSMESLEQTASAVNDNNVKQIIKEPEYALSPSACFHTYIEYENKTLKNNTIVTFRQNVFRNEGRLNYNEIGRLCDYHVREIVMIGSNEFVVEIRDTIMEKSVEIMKMLELKGDITLASDSFVVPKMQMYRKIQRIDKSKYEMHMNVNESKSISTASFNFHGKAFTDPFNIRVEGCEDTVTACVGFGLQRWVIAFLSQYSLDEENWPETVKKKFIDYMKEKRM